jgi:hypothetical protein
MRSQAIENGAEELVALLDLVIELLVAGGNPAGLGTKLTSIYTQVWKAIVERLA